MSEDPKSIWKKSWKGPRGLFLWFILLTASAFVVIFCLGLVSAKINPIGELAVIALLCGIGFALAGVLMIAFVRWICCWRNFRRFLFGFACFVTLIALLYAEENWRGKHAWENFKREWEAKGEKFDLKSFIPPPVPDEKNLAMSPIVASTYRMMLDGKGHEQKPRDTNVVNRLELAVEAEKVHMTIGWHWQKGEKTDLKVWQEYYREAAAITNEFPVPPLPRTPAEDVLFALSKYDSVIEELRTEANQRPDSRFPLVYEDGFPPAILLPHLARMKGCIRVLQLRAIAELKNGQSEKALDDIKLALRLTDSIRSEPFLISHLVRIAMMSIAMQPIWEGCAEHRWSDKQLAELQQELGKMDFLADYEFTIRGERGLSISTIDYMRQRPRYVSEIDEIFSTGEEKNHGIKKSLANIFPHLIPSSFFYQNELAIARASQQFLLPLVDIERRIVSPETMLRNQKTHAEERKHRSPYNILARMLLPALDKSVKKFAVIQEHLDLARIACALERYHLAHKEYPETLDALAPQFIEKIPNDIINGQPLKYKLVDDSFVLYSVGWNEKDDGGAVVLTKGSSPGVDSDKGDWVWRQQ